MGVFRLKDKRHYGNDEEVAAKIKGEQSAGKSPLTSLKLQPKKKAESKRKGGETDNE